MWHGWNKWIRFGENNFCLVGLGRMYFVSCATCAWSLGHDSPDLSDLPPPGDLTTWITAMPLFTPAHLPGTPFLFWLSDDYSSLSSCVTFFKDLSVPLDRGCHTAVHGPNLPYSQFYMLCDHTKWFPQMNLCKHHGDEEHWLWIPSKSDVISPTKQQWQQQKNAIFLVRPALQRSVLNYY